MPLPRVPTGMSSPLYGEPHLCPGRTPHLVSALNIRHAPIMSRLNVCKRVRVAANSVREWRDGSCSDALPFGAGGRPLGLARMRWRTNETARAIVSRHARTGDEATPGVFVTVLLIETSASASCGASAWRARQRRRELQTPRKHVAAPRVLEERRGCLVSKLVDVSGVVSVACDRALPRGDALVSSTILKSPLQDAGCAICPDALEAADKVRHSEHGVPHGLTKCATYSQLEVGSDERHVREWRVACNGSVVQVPTDTSTHPSGHDPVLKTPSKKTRAYALARQNTRRVRPSMRPLLVMSKVTLTVPKGKESCAQWLRDLSPEAVVQALEVLQTMYTLVRTTTSSDMSDVVKAHATQISALRAEQQSELLRVVEELRPAIEAQAKHTTETMAQDHAAERKTLEAQLTRAKKEAVALRTELDQAVVDASAALDDQRVRLERVHSDVARRLEEADEEIKRLVGERSVFKESVREEGDKYVEGLRRDYEGRLTQLRDIYTEQMGRSDAQHAQELERLTGLLDEQRALGQQMREGQFAKVENILGSLCGSSQRRGELGEALVKQIHDTLNLGVLQGNSHTRSPGVADFTWSYTPPGDVRAVSALVENKFSHSGDSTCDVDKFMRDVDVAVRAGRVNAALYLSLIRRVAGRPKLSVDMVHGVPVMWASRDASDDMSAASLVEVAFSAFAATWPMLCGRDDDSANVALQKVSALLNAQVDEYARLEPRITFLEKTSNQMRSEAVLLRKSRDTLVRQITNFQISNPSVCVADLQEEVEGLEDSVLTAVRTYHQRKRGYYPKHADDLKAFLPAEELRALFQRPEIFQSCERRVRAEKQASKKKRVAPDCDERDAEESVAPLED